MVTHKMFSFGGKKMGKENPSMLAKVLAEAKETARPKTQAERQQITVSFKKGSVAFRLLPELMQRAGYNKNSQYVERLIIEEAERQVNQE